MDFKTFQFAKLVGFVSQSLRTVKINTDWTYERSVNTIILILGKSLQKRIFERNPPKK